jgi:hypothetical protein
MMRVSLRLFRYHFVIAVWRAKSKIRRVKWWEANTPQTQIKTRLSSAHGLAFLRANRWCAGLC